MLKSMTGFARHSSQFEGGSLIWEIKTLNHRYLEQSIKLPEELHSLEIPVREKIATYIRRGKVECHCRYQPRAGKSLCYQINTDAAKQIMDLHQQAAELTQGSTRISAHELLAWPGVVDQIQADTNELHESAIEALQSALQELLANRIREGKNLKNAIQERCASLTGIITQLQERLPDIRVNLQNRLRERLDAIDIEVDEGRLEQELVIQLQKMDVDEELDRLQAHISEVNEVLEREDAIGRRLDFLMQELNREANTLGSKSIAIDTSNAAIDMKVLIEQMREQVQNIE